MIVGNTNFCISDNPVFPNHLNRLKMPDIWASPASMDYIPSFVSTDKMALTDADGKISVGTIASST
jgi:hypothetical protein